MIDRELIKNVKQIEIKTRGLVNQVFSGEYHSVFKGKGMEFSEVREYQIGDDIRMIDWNVTARLGHPYVKVMEEERELTVILMIDASGSLFFGSKDKTKRRVAAEISAILAFSALKNNDKTGLILFSDQIEKFALPKKGRSHSLRIIRDILSFEAAGKNTNLKNSLEFLLSTIKKRAVVFLISDFFDEGYERALSAVARKHDLICLNVYDPRDYDLPAIGMAKLKDAESGDEIYVDLSDKTFRREFNETIERLQSERKRIFAKYKIDFADIRIDRDYIKPLVELFKNRERRWRI